MTPASWSPPRGLDPTPPEARDWLRQELQGSEYQNPWLESARQWLLDQLRKLFDGLDQLANSGISPVITVLLALVVIALLVWVLPKVRRNPVVATSKGAVLQDLTITARFYRDLAAQALRDGRYGEAVLDGFRAIAKDTSDRTLLDDAPGRTAHEVSLSLAPRFPDHADQLARAADLFDSVRYGHRRATAEQALHVQRLDAELVKTRPVPTTLPLQSLPV
jgi:hypothetical protein